MGPNIQRCPLGTGVRSFYAGRDSRGKVASAFATYRRELIVFSFFGFQKAESPLTEAITLYTLGRALAGCLTSASSKTLHKRRPKVKH